MEGNVWCHIILLPISRRAAASRQPPAAYWCMWVIIMYDTSTRTRKFNYNTSKGKPWQLCGHAWGTAGPQGVLSYVDDRKQNKNIIILYILYITRMTYNTYDNSHHHHPDHPIFDPLKLTTPSTYYIYSNNMYPQPATQHPAHSPPSLKIRQTQHTSVTSIR